MGYAADRAEQIGRRVEPRFPSRIAAMISSDDHQIFGVIEDLSAHGAKLETEYMLKLGARITVRSLGMAASGAIIWRTGKKCGVQFDQSIDPQEVMRQNDGSSYRHRPVDLAYPDAAIEGREHRH
jgi:hypothetical protein